MCTYMVWSYHIVLFFIIHTDSPTNLTPLSFFNILLNILWKYIIMNFKQ